VLLLGLAFYMSQQSYRSTTFSGPEFHSLNASDTGAVYSELSRHLVAMGFAPSASPSDLDSWAGIHTEGATRTWFARRESRGQASYVSIDRDEVAVRTSVKWEARGSDTKLESAERLAYATALDLDAGFNVLTQPNSLPPKMREEKRRGFEEHLAGNH